VAHRLGLRTVVAVPLLDGDEVLGVLSVGFASSSFEGADDAGYLQMVARECRRALVRARRSDQDRRAARWNELRRRSTARLLQEPDAPSVVRSGARIVSEALGAEAAGAVLIDQPGTVVFAGTEELDRSLAGLGIGIEGPAEQLARWASAGDGRSAFCETSDEIRDHWPEVGVVTDALGLRSMAVVPLVGELGPFGAFVIAFGSDRTFDAATRTFLEAVGSDIGQALIRARLTAAERAAKRDAERAAEHAALLASVSREIPVTRPIEERLQVFLDRLVPRFADLGAATLLDRDVAADLTAMSDPRWKDVLEEPRIRALVAQALRRADASRDVVIADASLHDRSPGAPVEPADPEPGALAVVPLERAGQLLGSLILLLDRRRGPVGLAEVDLLRATGYRIAISIENAYLFERQQRIAVQLQRSLTGDMPSGISGLEVAAHQTVGERGAVAGGDWCDVLTFADGRPGLLIGDVVGRGLGAAAAMGQLRAAMIALANVSEGPAELFRRVDAAVHRFPGAELATVACLAIDASSGWFTLASAGHLPPLVISGGTTEFLWDGRSLPLGVSPLSERVEAAHPMPPDALILLYTDGLIERRGEEVDIGLARLADVAARADRRTANDFIESLLALIAADEEPGDDTTLIVGRLTPSARLGDDRAPGPKG
jgi:serine/threonine-protein kinase RsbW